MGETARLLLKTTRARGDGLVTIERDGVIEKRLITVGAGTSTSRSRSRRATAPNVYASVVLVKGRTGKGAAGKPRHPHGHDDAGGRHRGQAAQGRGRDRQAELPAGRDGDRGAQGDRRRGQAGAGRGRAVGRRRGRAVADRLQDARPDDDVLRGVGAGRHDRDAIRAAGAPARAGRGALRDRRRRRGRAGDVPLAVRVDRVLEPALETDADGHAKVSVQGARQPDRVPPDGGRRRRRRPVRLGRQALDRAQAAAAARARCRAS